MNSSDLIEDFFWPMKGLLDNLGNVVSINLSFDINLELSNSLSFTIISSSVSSLSSFIFNFFVIFFPEILVLFLWLVGVCLLVLSFIDISLFLLLGLFIPVVKCLL